MTYAAARQSVAIVVADDDPDDRLMAEEALREARLANQIYFVEDGEALVAFLKRTPPFEDPEKAPRPGLILLDLNMPKLDGREALEIIKADPELRRIPVVVLTTSRAEEDIYRSYDLGVAGYISKPVTFDGLVAAMRQLGYYWFELVELPDRS